MYKDDHLAENRVIENEAIDYTVLPVVKHQPPLVLVDLDSTLEY